MGVLLLVAPSLLENLPQTALAAVVIASALGLFEIADLRRIYRIQRWEFWLSAGCLAGVAVFGAIPGIALAILAALIEFLWDGWRPHWAVLGRPPNLRGYHDVTRHPDARQIPGLVLFRWDAPLFFANAGLFNRCVMEAVKRAPTRAQWVVVAAEPVTSVDVTAADALAELDQSLQDAGIELGFAEMKDPVMDKLKRFGLFSSLGEKAFFPRSAPRCARTWRRTTSAGATRTSAEDARQLTFSWCSTSMTRPTDRRVCCCESRPSGSRETIRVVVGVSVTVSMRSCTPRQAT